MNINKEEIQQRQKSQPSVDTLTAGRQVPLLADSNVFESRNEQVIASSALMLKVGEIYSSNLYLPSGAVLYARYTILRKSTEREHDRFWKNLSVSISSKALIWHYYKIQIHD